MRDDGRGGAAERRCSSARPTSGGQSRAAGDAVAVAFGRILACRSRRWASTWMSCWGRWFPILQAIGHTQPAWSEL